MAKAGLDAYNESIKPEEGYQSAITIYVIVFAKIRRTPSAFQICVEKSILLLFP